MQCYKVRCSQNHTVLNQILFELRLVSLRGFKLRLLPGGVHVSTLQCFEGKQSFWVLNVSIWRGQIDVNMPEIAKRLLFFIYSLWQIREKWARNVESKNVIFFCQTSTNVTTFVRGLNLQSRVYHSQSVTVYHKVSPLIIYIKEI